jgi:Zn-finger nucleic acid-binding protein
VSPGTNCPECGSPLPQERHLGIQLDVCDRCQGIWFDHGELKAYWSASKSVDGPPPVDPARFEADPGCTTLACPCCTTDTLAVRRVDVFNGGPCSACLGVWLGRAEIGRLDDR